MKYQQVKKELVDYIVQKDLRRNGKCLPSENELCELFRASRMTVRKAINELETEKYLYRIKGKGTFVVQEALINQSLSRLTGFTEDIRARGQEAHSKILLCEMGAATTEIAEKLGLVAGDDIVILRRLRLLDDEPIGIETSYLRGDLFARLLQENMGESLYAYMREVLNIFPTRAFQSIEVGRLVDWEATLLGDQNQHVALLTHRQTFDKNGQPIEYAISKYRSNRYTYFVELRCD